MFVFFLSFRILGSGYRRAILTNRHVVNDSTDKSGNTVFQGDFHVSHNFEGTKQQEDADSFVDTKKTEKRKKRK